MLETPPALLPWAAGLHEEVRRVASEAGPRRHLPSRAWVGRPGGRRGDDVLLLPDPPAGLPAAAAAGLRADLVERALDGVLETGALETGALCWVTRSGDLGTGDVELAWWAAARRAFARHDEQMPAFCVLNRFGWTDLLSGAGRTWARVRPRRDGHRPRSGAGSGAGPDEG